MSNKVYVISETVASVWHYHLREVDNVGLKMGGGAPPALCGAALGWDTEIPLDAWGTKDHIPSKWCSECGRLWKETNPQAAELVLGVGHE